MKSTIDLPFQKRRDSISHLRTHETKSLKSSHFQGCFSTGFVCKFLLGLAAGAHTINGSHLNSNTYLFRHNSIKRSSITLINQNSETKGTRVPSKSINFTRTWGPRLITINGISKLLALATRVRPNLTSPPPYLPTRSTRFRILHFSTEQTISHLPT